MYGATLKGNPRYGATELDPTTPTPATRHPRTTALREDRIVRTLDDWLNELTDAEHRETTIATVFAADTERTPEPQGVQAAGGRCGTYPSSSTESGPPIEPDGPEPRP